MPQLATAEGETMARRSDTLTFAGITVSRAALREEIARTQHKRVEVEKRGADVVRSPTAGRRTPGSGPRIRTAPRPVPWMERASAVRQKLTAPCYRQQGDRA